MDGEIRCRGKTYTSKEIDEIREVIAAHPGKSRWFISRELCRKWNWIQPNGVLKDMICRGLLLRLNAQRLNDGGAAAGHEHAGEHRAPGEYALYRPRLILTDPPARLPTRVDLTQALFQLISVLEWRQTGESFADKGGRSPWNPFFHQERKPIPLQWLLGVLKI